MFALMAQRSKYDFWIPGGILTLEIKIQKQTFFLDVKFVGSKKKFGDFFGSKKISSSKIENVEEKSKFRFFLNIFDFG